MISVCFEFSPLLIFFSPPNFLLTPIEADWGRFGRSRETSARLSVLIFQKPTTSVRLSAWGLNRTEGSVFTPTLNQNEFYHSVWFMEFSYNKRDDLNGIFFIYINKKR